MKVLFLTKYGRLAANTRFRCLQYLPHLEAAGIECSTSHLLDDDYLKHRFESGRFKMSAIFRAFSRRLKALFRIKNFDAVVLHYELFPYFPPVFEFFLKLFNVKYLCDFDDAVFSQYENHSNPIVRWLLKSKIQRVIYYSDGVLAGNSYLARYARRLHPNVSILPTVVDLAHYGKATQKQLPSRPFRIGWIGSPSTARYIHEVSGALKKFCLNHHAELVLVGSGKIDLPGVPTTYCDWSEETELDHLSQFDVGIMPLPDNAWTRGKCGFKIIQYMATKTPTIASPVGVNQDIVEHGKSGFLAETESEWIEALNYLYDHPKQRREMGEQGFKHIKKKYSLEVVAPRLAQQLKKTLPKSPPLKFKNVDTNVTKAFGEEWAYFQQNLLSEYDLEKIFWEYFSIFPWMKVHSMTVGADIGCGSGRWAKFVAPQVRHLHCIDASEKALEVAKKHLNKSSNVSFHHTSIGNLPFRKSSLDFAYCLGVIHHLPDHFSGLKSIAHCLKPGAPFLFYMYYAFENRSRPYRILWKITDLARRVICRFPFSLKFWTCQMIALVVYWPLARMAKLLSFVGMMPRSWLLSYYKDKPFYVMRNDALDRFGTRLEKRFTQQEMKQMLVDAGFSDVKFSPSAPFWVGVAFRNN